MGSFAFRASQFFESIGKKKRLSSVSSMSNLKERTSTTSSLASPITPLTPETPVFLPEIPSVPTARPISHQGYLCIYSNFNKRKWGKRWCLVRDNTFECYRHEKSTVCELDFILRYCKLRRAIVETKSELGLMLVEKAGEKITIEPLSREEMCGWLKILMKETSTEKIPEGLEEFWVVDEESPYHDINPQDLSSPTSEEGGYTSIKDYLESQQQKNPEVETKDSAFDITIDTNLIPDNQIPVSPELSEINDVSQVPGEVTGALYSQVRRKSSIETATIESLINDSRVPDSVFTFSEEETSHTQNKGDTSIQNNTLAENEGMFAEIFSKINDHFNQNNCDVICEEEKQSDTAYNSAVCSENSSLERKPHQDVHSVSDNLDTLSQGTDIMVSPLEDFSPAIQTSNDVDFHNEGYENHISAKTISDQSNNSMQFFSQSTRTNFELTNTVLDQSNNSMQFFNQSTRTNFELTNTFLDQSNNSVQTINQSEMSSFEWTNERNLTHLSVESKSVSRDQCDSAIFESESILEDLDASPKALLCKIEQLRTHLVELKKTRISVRNQKEQAVRDLDKNHLDEEYNKLDEECRIISDEISFLEERLSLHVGYTNS